MKILIGIILILSISYLGGYWLRNKERPDVTSEIYLSDCDITKTGCRIIDADLEYKIMFEGQPSPLKPFSVKVVTEKVQPESIEIEFLMQGMDMGFNHYAMELDGSAWQTKVILPVCSLGSNEWILKVKVSGKDSIHLTQLKFLQ